MVRVLTALFRRPSIRTGLARVPGRRLRDPRFVSFMAASNRKTLDTDFQDAVLQGRRLFKQLLVVMLVAGGIWIVVESAQALTLF